MMFETDVLIGGGLLVGFTALGAGEIGFIEKRTLSGDSLSDETKTKMAAMFMEDEELSTTNLDDTISKMEKALAEAEGRDVVEGDGLTEAEKAELKEAGWGD